MVAWQASGNKSGQWPAVPEIHQAMPSRLLPRNTALRAGLFMVLAMGSFVANDTCVKIVGTSLPVGELMGLRGMMSVTIIAAIAFHQGVIAEAGQIATRPVLLRASLDLIATVAFVTALMHMQIANLTAILQAVPLAVALLSAAILGERVGVHRAAAIAAGFAGVLLIVRPSPQSFSTADGLALVVVFAVAARDLVTRRIPAKVPGPIVALANAGFVTAGGWAMGIYEDFIVPQAWQVGVLALASMFLTSGYLFMVATLRLGELSATAPFRYSILLFAIISGIVVFREFPDRIAVLGMILIVAAGLYAASREWRLRDSARKPAP
jgi:drug/metabolite transporter (DMT)-like permease